MSIVEGYWPNRLIAQYSTSSTSWEVVATDGTGYSTLAALTAAGKTPFGVTAIGPGATIGQLTIRTENGGADGSPMWYQINGSAPSGTGSAEFVSGSGQTIIDSPGQMLIIWVQKTTAGDTVILQAKY